MSIYLPQRVSVLALCCMAFAASAADTPRIDAEWDMRLRHEWVDDAAFAQEANASTLRMRAGLRFVGNNGWNGLVEAEGAAATGDYNSGANGRATYPQVLDPRGVELNQAWLGWKGSNASVTLGRQRLLFDNQRWVGNVGWRQNEQTFDALAVEAAPVKDLSLRYAYLDRVHRVAGDDALDPLARERKLSTHLLHAGWKRDKQLLSGYAFLHEDRDVASASSATIGLRWAGSRSFASGTLGWSLEAARQRDYANNPLQFSHNYWLLEPVLTMQGGQTCCVSYFDQRPHQAWPAAAPLVKRKARAALRKARPSWRPSPPRHSTACTAPCQEPVSWWPNRAACWCARR